MNAAGSGAFRLMGIVNVTPDSFSDGGRFLRAEAAIEHGLRLIGDGAAIIDVGGESTRPGARPVAVEEELRRVAPVVERLAAQSTAQISIDTSKAQVARAALRAGASFVNDVSALRSDPQMAAAIAESSADCCLMHMPSDPGAGEEPRYEDVVDDVRAFLEERLAFALGAGIPEQRVWLDPGIGFGKTVEQNLELLARLPELVSIGRPIVIGTSRKRFLARIADRDLGCAEDPARAGERGPAGPSDRTAEGPRRLAATVASNVLALERGASVFRVHDVAPARAALAVAAATLGKRWTATSTGTTRTS